MELTAKELLEHIKKNGITLAKTTEDFIDIPSGRKLWFGIECNEDVISSYDRNTDDKNDYFNYDFDYQWSNIWHNDYKSYKGKFIYKGYKGKFIIEEEKYRQYGHHYIGVDLAKAEFRQDNKPKVKIMQTLTNTLKKILPGDIQKQYRAGFRNGNLALTDYGQKELLELLADKFKKELTDRAIEVIKEEEKK